MSHSNYYTFGFTPRVNKSKNYGKDLFVLVINYENRFDRVVRKKLIAKSTERKFHSDNFPARFDSKQAAAATVVAFQQYVENIVRGKRPIQYHSSPTKLPPALTNKNRAIRLFQRRVKERASCRKGPGKKLTTS